MQFTNARNTASTDAIRSLLRPFVHLYGQCCNVGIKFRVERGITG